MWLSGRAPAPKSESRGFDSHYVLCLHILLRLLFSSILLHWPAPMLKGFLDDRDRLKTRSERVLKVTDMYSATQKNPKTPFSQYPISESNFKPPKTPGMTPKTPDFILFES